MTSREKHILWLGAASYTDSSESISALKHILDCASVEYTCIEECDTAEELRSRGDEYTFEICARKNIENLHGSGIRRIITPCPHSYGVISHVYPSFGLSDFKVWHHTDFILQLLKEGALSIKKPLSGLRVCYHDPCRLSRRGMTENCREIITILGGVLIEPPFHGADSMCCGGGAFLDDSDIPVRVSVMRYEDLLSTSAEVIVTACPVCRDMLSAARCTDNTRVCDIATLVDSCL